VNEIKIVPSQARNVPKSLADLDPSIDCRMPHQQLKMLVPVMLLGIIAKKSLLRSARRLLREIRERTD